jgi:hypothetical protein
MPKESVDQLFAEMRALIEEFDYENESRHRAPFRGLRDEPERSPGGERTELTPCTDNEYVSGDHVSEVTTERYDQATINEFGERLFLHHGRPVIQAF